MEIIDPNQKREYESRQIRGMHSGSSNETRGRVYAGLILLIIGITWLIRKMGIVDLPDWLFHWPAILIAVGIFVGAKHNFAPGGWIVLIVIGFIWWFDFWYPIRPYMFPIILIAVAAYMILGPRRRYRRTRYRGDSTSHSGNQGIADKATNAGFMENEIIESVSIFGSNKKRYSGSNFKGGESVAIFGGAEIDLSQADIQSPVKLEVVQIFGGTKLMLPAHWNVRSEMVSIFGTIEDTRSMQQQSANPEKTLILEGVSFMGSIQIKSF